MDGALLRSDISRESIDDEAVEESLIDLRARLLNTRLSVPRMVLRGNTHVHGSKKNEEKNTNKRYEIQINKIENDRIEAKRI